MDTRGIEPDAVCFKHAVDVATKVKSILIPTAVHTVLISYSVLRVNGWCSYREIGIMFPGMFFFLW